eukprot:2116696-Amphidinium_carterae.1
MSQCLALPPAPVLPQLGVPDTHIFQPSLPSELLDAQSQHQPLATNSVRALQWMWPPRKSAANMWVSNFGI